jgi:acetate kinase
MMEAALRIAPDAPSIAVFDTAFHRTIPDVAALYALPWDLSERLHLRRYGFHGLSHKYVSERLLELMERKPEGTRVITCHLGNGTSICAVRDGKSVDTSMGFTPLEGLVMGTRSGDVDPGLLIYLLQSDGMAPAALDTVLNEMSGLSGVSGRSSDVRDLEAAAADGDARSELALAMFAYRARKYIGAYAAAMGGVDAVAFTGGIGEHSSSMRSRIVDGLQFLGVDLDPTRNSASTDGPRPICRPESRVAVWVVPTNEELELAREVAGMNIPKKSAS